MQVQIHQVNKTQNIQDRRWGSQPDLSEHALGSTYGFHRETWGLGHEDFSTWELQKSP